LRSDFQATIFSLSFFAWKCRKTTFRSLCLMTFLWISATDLESDQKYHQPVTRIGHCWYNSRRQLLDCLAHGAVEVVQPLPIQSSVQGGTDFSAGQPKFDVIHLVNHRVLGAFQPTFDQQKTRRELTLITVRITLTEPKTAWAGVILESSFARFKASIAPFSTEIVLSRSLGSRDSASMVETRSSCGGNRAA